MNDNLISLREFGRRLGVSDTAVRKAIASGRIEKEADGRINFTRQKRNWEENRDPSKIRKSLSPVNPGMKSIPTQKPEEGYSRDPTFAKAKLARETYTAKLCQLEYERESGKVIEKSKVVETVQRYSRWVRDCLVTIPERTAAGEAAGFVNYLKSILFKKCGKEVTEEIIQEIDLSEAERIVRKAWDKETREVLTSLLSGPKV